MKHKGAFFLVLFIFLIGFGKAQNLVPNFSFEETSYCTKGHDGVEYWTTPPSLSPDYMSTCHSQGQNGVPVNRWGYSFPKSGQAYFGFLGNDKHNNAREYLETELLHPLFIGEEYCFRLWYKVPSDCMYFSDGLGVLFSKRIHAVDTHPYKAINDAQIENPTGHFMRDTIWSKFEGSFVADSAYTNMHIGFFKEFHEVNFEVYDSAHFLPDPMYYIDDVYLYRCSDIYQARTRADQELCMEEADHRWVEIGFDSVPVQGYSYRWYPDYGLTDPTVSNPKAQPMVDTTYYLEQIDFLGDTTYDSVRITYRQCWDDPEQELYFPSAFSPDGDGINEVWGILGHYKPSDVQLSIYNRWGGLVYESSQPTQTWDGRHFKTQEILPPGVYVYQINYRNAQGILTRKQGRIVLLR